MTGVAAALCARAYRQGFAAGADPCRTKHRHAVDPATHEHWRRGYEAGRDASEAAERAYRAKLEAVDSPRGPVTPAPDR